MSDPRDEDVTAPERQSGTNTTLRDALRALAAGGSGGVGGASLSPQMIADLARTAGLTGTLGNCYFR